MTLNREFTAELERVGRENVVQDLPPSLLQYIRGKGPFVEIAFRLDLNLECRDFAKLTLERENSPTLKETTRRFQAIEKSLGIAGREIAKLDGFELELLKCQGPLGMKLRSTSYDLATKARVDELPWSGCDVRTDRSDDWISRLGAFSQLLGAATGTLQAYLGAENIDMISKGGRQTLNSISSAHPNWCFVYELCVFLSDWLNHGFGSEKTDHALLQNFTDDVLAWKFPNYQVDIGTYVTKFYRCIHDIRVLISKIEQLDLLLEKAANDENRTESELLKDREACRDKLCLRRVFLICGPERTKRGDPAQILTRFPNPEFNLGPKRMVACSPLRPSQD